MKPRVKKSFIEDQELYKCVSYAIHMMADYEVMTTHGAVSIASKKYNRTPDEIYVCLGRDFKISGLLLNERRKYRKRYACKENENAATLKTLDSLGFGM